jgi:hypothetical protein
MIRAHKVLACLWLLIPRIASGKFDRPVTAHMAFDRELLRRGGVAISASWAVAALRCCRKT